MSYVAKPLTIADNRSLLALSRSTDTGSDMFVVDRSPDFFALGTSWGDTEHMGLWRNDELIGCWGVTEQIRLVTGEPVSAPYLHDVRIHPAYHGTRAYQRLMHHIVSTLKERYQWVYGTVWESNRHRVSLTRGATFFPSPVLIGKTVHLGVPLFWPTKETGETVVPITADTAWAHYEKWASRISFAYMDHERFLAPDGHFLAICEGGRLRAVCKVVDQSPVRKLVASHSLPIGLRLANFACWMRGTPPLPSIGKPFVHGYLAFYASEDAQDYRQAFFSYLARHHQHEYTYVFCGMDQETARAYRHPLYIKLHSFTYAYGDAPKGFQMQAHELTLL